MATTEVAVSPHLAADRSPIVNDLSLQVGTVNGSGSQSSNSVLLRTIFQMGVPVSGKNLFPSNIAGLPTWYTIRASKHGYVARKREVDFLVAMNAETAKEDVMTLEPGRAAIYDEPLKLNELRDDVTFYPVPFDKLTATVCPEAKLRKLVKNMVYVGVVANLLHLDMAEVEKAIRSQFAKKKKAADMNWSAAQAGYDYAVANLTKQDPYKIEPMDENQGKIIVDGNGAAALGAMFAGVTVVTWYPITPSSSLVEQLIDYMNQYRMTPEGKATFAIVQAEDELAAVGMVLGAGWAGARSMTSTSGPGISLMGEFAGLGYYAEVPGVIWNVQRTGPSTGLPTRTQQADLLSTAFLSHGDTKHIMLLPGSVKECYEFAGEAFDAAEQFQTPVFVLSDLDLGMNNWMSDKFEYPTKPLNRGKVLHKAELEQLAEWGRYADVDGDGIPYRTLPGTDSPRAAYFTRGSGHNAKAQYTERSDDYENNMARLSRKFETARNFVPQPMITGEGNKVGILAFGSSNFAVLESRDQLRTEAALEADYIRVRAYPFHKRVAEFINAHEHVYVVEQNRDAQMLSLLKLDLDVALLPKLRSYAYSDGMPLDARSITDFIKNQEGK